MCRRARCVAVAGIAAIATLTAQQQAIAIRAGRLFDAKAGAMLQNQVVLIRGERIVEVGASVTVPAGARMIDLSNATVLPGMIDAHVHVALNVPNESFEHHTFVMIQSAQRDLVCRLLLEKKNNFKGADQQKKVGSLSDGERNRVHLAKMLKSGANVLLLDEHTTE